MRSILSILKFLIGWPLSIIALYFIAKLISLNLKAILFQTHINASLLFTSILCFLAYFFFRAFAWQKILNASNHQVKLSRLAYLWELSELRRYIPGNIWSFLSRAVLFSKYNIPQKTMVKSLVIEAQQVIIGCVLVSLLGIQLISNSIFNIWNAQFENIILLLSFLLIVFYIFSPNVLNYFNKNYLAIFKKLLPQNSYKINFWIVFLSAVSYFFFGLGTYFSIASIVFLNPQLFLELTGFFTFSLLVGYLSFITPMGLGVREAVVTTGLSKLMNVSIAGFASVFSRIIFILAELLFLLFSFVYYKYPNKLVMKFEHIAAYHKHETILVFFVVVYMVYFTTASFLRFDNFYTGRFDLGNMSQTVWNSAQGRIFQFTDPDSTQTTSRLSYHADYILVLFAPLYKLWPSPKLLLVSQTIIVAIGAFFAYLLSQKILRNKTISLVLAAAYLLNPGLQYTNLYDFHAVTLATTFLLGAFYFLITKRYVWFLLLSVFSAITKEQVWIIVAFFGVYIVLSTLKNTPYTKKILVKQTLGLCLTLVSLGFFYFFIWHAIPGSRGASHFALSYYSDFGQSPSGIVKNILFSPQKIISTLLTGGRLEYLKQLFLPFGFLPLFSPMYLLFAAPDLAINLLSNNTQLHQIYYQYTATITPFLFVAAIFGIRIIRKLFPRIPYILYTIYLILATLYSSYAFGPLPGTKNPNIDMFVKPQPHKELIQTALKNIPPRYSVAATNNLGSHLSNREHIFTIPVGLEEADIVAFLLDDPFAQPSPQAQREMVQQLKQNKAYIILLEKDKFILFQKILRNLAKSDFSYYY